MLRDHDARIALVTPKAVPWRRVLHAHPERSLSAERTDRVVPTQLKPPGLEVRSNLGGTFSVVGISRGGRLGPAVPTSVKVLSALAIDALAHGVAPLGTMK